MLKVVRMIYEYFELDNIGYCQISYKWHFDISHLVFNIWRSHKLKFGTQWLNTESTLALKKFLRDFNFVGYARSCPFFVFISVLQTVGLCLFLI